LLAFPDKVFVSVRPTRRRQANPFFDFCSVKTEKQPFEQEKSDDRGILSTSVQKEVLKVDCFIAPFIYSFSQSKCRSVLYSGDY